MGFGIGNSIAPIRLGYDTARSEYKNNYMREVNDLGNENYLDDSVTYSLPFRIMSEYGIIMFFIALLYLIQVTKTSHFQYKWLLFAIIIYLYVQFESLAFYSLWLFIVIMKNTRRLKNAR